MVYGQLPSDYELGIELRGRVGVLTLNRPGVLNALSLDMIRLLQGSLRRWAEDDAVAAVVIRGAGNKAFCAGGDVKAAYYAGMDVRRGDADDRIVRLFFEEEYQLNRYLFHYPKPIIAMMNGITMGGGYGVAGPCRFRVACENTVFAMPEVGIGFFPDVGSTYFLNRLPGKCGMFLAVTGYKARVADMMHIGLATHYMPSGRFITCVSGLNGALEKARSLSQVERSIESYLDSMSKDPPGSGDIERHRDIIDRVFSGQTIEAMLATLSSEPDPWAAGIRAGMEMSSPLSIKVACAQMKRVAGMDFDDVIRQDFILAQRFLRANDFYEGVRAMLVSKDKMPAWDPPRLEKVTQAMVRDYFEPKGRMLVFE